MKTTKQKLKEDLRLILLIAAMAFVMGSVMAVGSKTVNKYWPDAPMQIEHIIKDQADPYWPTDVPMEGKSNAGI